MGQQIRKLIEYGTGVIIVLYVWSPFVTYSGEIVDFWDLNIWMMIWYLIRLAFTIYATWLIIQLFAGNDEVISNIVKKRKDRGL